MDNKFDFSGWATRSGVRCSDGRTIMRNAFKDCDGKTVPLVWNHRHNEVESVLGHALLKNMDEGVYAYCSFNDTERGQDAKKIVEHGDVCALSIFANELREQSKNVLHGTIREVSLVLAGANPEAFIDSIVIHADGSMTEEYDQGIIYTGEGIYLSHADEETEDSEEAVKESIEHADDENEDQEENISDVLESLNDKQKVAVLALLNEQKNNQNGDNKEDTEMKHNLFDHDTEETRDDVISHSEMMAVISDAKRYGSMKESCLQHGIENLEYLFPDDKLIPDNKFHFVSRDMKWVDTLMKGVHHTPFSRLKCIFADITGEDARALGYQKGNLKKDEMFALLKRTTEPTTIYKHQSFDRDDLVDITDFNVVGEVKAEMRTMLNEEIARAILIGDGRNAASDDKVDELKIRPIWTDDDFYTIHSVVTPTGANPTDTDKALEMIDQSVRAQDDYKGSGNLTLFADRKWITAALLAKDEMGHRLYKNVNDIATAMMVDQIVSVPVMKNRTRSDSTYTYTLMGIIVDLNDYNVGADKGGAVSMFDDFDIDYNRQKYLIETRISGSLVKPYAAIALELRAEN